MTYPPTFQIPSPYPAPGDIVDGKYRIERILGEGGMGAVAKAMHLLRRAPVALKFMSPAAMAMPDAVVRFLNESVAASRIDSDHVVNVYDVGQLPTGAPYLVMEYLEGQDLSELLAREGRPGLDIPRAVHFALQALRGLQVAHAAGIVHRDMKPSNCFVIYKDGEPDFLKLVDFGISKVAGAHGTGTVGGRGNLTATNSALGTPLYMSPEQARAPRDVDARTDLYAVGVILYELLTGRTPFQSESAELTEILFKLFTADAPPIRNARPDIPEGLAAAVHKAMARDREQRFASAKEMGEALAPWADARSQTVIQRLTSFSGLGSRPPPPPEFELPRIVVTPPQAQPHGMDPGGARLDAVARTHLSPEATPVPPQPPAQAQSGLTSVIPGARPPTGQGSRRSWWIIGVPAVALVGVVGAVVTAVALRGGQEKATGGPLAPSATEASPSAAAVPSPLPSLTLAPSPDPSPDTSSALAAPSAAVPSTPASARQTATAHPLPMVCASAPSTAVPKTSRGHATPPPPRPTFQEPSQINP